MTQEERWKVRYNEVKSFIVTNKRNPSKHRIEEHDMLNWMKANIKAFNAGKMKPERVEAFKRLLEMMEECKRTSEGGMERVLKRAGPAMGVIRKILRSLQWGQTGIV